jgi:hypothetical protein|tara:strand:+ start:646 stop:867 length:222 start_codon:yes stop_codon:yes gene_type:complete
MFQQCTFKTFPTGVDRPLFNRHKNEQTFFTEAFLVYSGGKLECRKGQNLVFRDTKVLQDKHKDMLEQQLLHGH